MMVKWLCLAGLVFGLALSGYSQSTRDVKTAPKPPAPRYQSTKKKEGFFLFRVFQRKDRKTNEVEEFRERLRKQYRQKAKEEKRASKPQYTDPTYFGHKNPPKKRKNGKKKFCKECGLAH